MDFNLIFLIICSAFIGALPIMFIKMYLNTNKLYFLFLTLSAYILLIKTYLIVFKDHDIITTFISIKILSDIFVIMSSVLFFKETLNIKKIIGILIAFVSVYLIST